MNLEEQSRILKEKYIGRFAIVIRSQTLYRESGIASEWWKSIGQMIKSDNLIICLDICDTPFGQKAKILTSLGKTGWIRSDSNRKNIGLKWI